MVDNSKKSKSSKNTWDSDLANEFKKRDNPSDFKEALKGVVICLNPLTVHIENGQATLTQGDQLIISEWFQKRWDIDKTTALSVDVPDLLSEAKAVTEIHSYTPNNSCNMPSAISYLASAIEKINAELFALKLDLKLKDVVILLPSDVTDKYFIIDKV